VKYEFVVEIIPARLISQPNSKNRDFLEILFMDY